MKENICCIFNFGSHYRKSIYLLMDRELKCDFYFGNKIPGNIKAMNYQLLAGYQKSLKNIYLFGNFYWQKGSIGLIFKRYKHIIIDGELYNISNWLILILSKLLGKKTYCWTHGWYGRESRVKIIIKKIFFGLSYHIFLYGDYARELMIKEGFINEKLSCIYNSLDYDKQLMIRKKLNYLKIYNTHFKNENLNLIFIGRLTRSKRIDILLHALKKLKNQSQNFNLTLIGDGECKNKLISLSVQLGLIKNIWFYGACYNEEKLAELIYNADLCVSPGNVGLTAMHSMSYGTPVLTHNNYPYQMPEFEAIINEKTGIFFEYENYISLAEKIRYWFSLNLDRGLIRKNCYDVIDTKYNPHYQISLLKNVILNLN